MSNHLHPFMKRGTYSNDVKPLSGWAGWVSDLGTRSGSISRVNRGSDTLDRSGGKWGYSEVDCEDHIPYVGGENAPYMGLHLRRKLVTIFGRGIERESSK